MKSLDPYFGILANHAKNGVFLLGHSGIVEWPSSTIASLQQTGVLVPTQNATHVQCPGCHESCYVEPDVYELSDGNYHLQILCRRQGCRVDIDAELVNQYEIIPEKLKELGYQVEEEKADYSQSDCLYSYEWLGDTWRLIFAGEETTIRNLTGARLLATLLCNPYKDLYCLDLQAQESRNPILNANEFEDVVADSEAIDAYKEALLEWQEKLDDARSHNDFSRIDKAQQQIDFIAGHLLKIQGFNGRTRTFGSNVERARKSVRKNLQSMIHSDAMGKIPHAQQHFNNSITYGRFINYSPEKEIDWNVIKKF